MFGLLHYVHHTGNKDCYIKVCYVQNIRILLIKICHTSDLYFSHTDWLAWK